MARSRFPEDSDSDLPELDELISRHVKGLYAPKLDATKTAATRLPRQKGTGTSSRTAQPSKKLSATTKTVAEKGPLEPSTVQPLPNSTKKSVQQKPLPNPTKKSVQQKPRQAATLGEAHASDTSKTRATPHRLAKTCPISLPPLDDSPARETKNAIEEQDVEESIWCESDEDDMPKKLGQRPLNALSKRPPPRRWTPDTELSDSEHDMPLRLPPTTSPKAAATPLTPRKTCDDLTRKLLMLDLDSDKENDNQALLRFSPPRTTRPILARPSTPPPASPSKSRLVSPSKKKPQIPTPPHHHPQVEDFWNVHAVNTWNDHHSPQKPLLSPKKNRKPIQDDSDSPLSSPKKNQSPTKRTRAVMDAKKEFENSKHQLAEDFFHELDTKITDGKIQELAACTGGVKFIWSKTLNSTAGRANWKRDSTKTRNLDGTTTTTQRHHASIELAEKVIDDQERLLNVVAHEFCHLANFMVSGIKDQPHGQQFKLWGRKVSETFGDRGVEVTTKHSYRIDYKYIWTCTNDICGHEFKRHSKSIDPARHTCGVCRGKLEQTKPVPRKQGSNATGYAAFVKENFAVLKREMVGAAHKDVMAAMGQRYREQKAKAAEVAAATGLDDVAKAFEVVTLDSD